MLRLKSASPTANLISGRRILALGASFAGLAEGPLKGAAVEMGSVAQLESLPPGAFDLVLIDWRMPDLDGFATARRIGDLDLTRPPALILVSAAT